MKFTINGEEFAYPYDFAHMPLSEALAIEKAAKRRYVEWEAEFTGGSAEAMAVFIHLVWQHAGRDVDLADILSGEVPVDFTDACNSVMKALAAEVRARDVQANPTSPAVPPGDPAGTDTTSSDTRASSPRS